MSFPQSVGFSLSALALASAAVLAIGRPGGRRGFVAGFAVIGGSYLLLSLFPESGAQLPTSDLLVALEKQVFGSWTMGAQILSLSSDAAIEHSRKHRDPVAQEPERDRPAQS